MNKTKEQLISDIKTGLNQIMELSYPVCKSNDSTLSALYSNINNIAHDLKKKVESLSLIF